MNILILIFMMIAANVTISHGATLMGNYGVSTTGYVVADSINAAQISATTILMNGVSLTSLIGGGSPKSHTTLATSFNFSNTKVIYTSAACGSYFVIDAIPEGGPYYIIVQGNPGGTAVFATNDGTLTLKKPDTAFSCNTTVGSHTVFTLVRANNFVYVMMTTGLRSGVAAP